MDITTVSAIQDYLDHENPLDLAGADVSVIGGKNHAMFRLQKGTRLFALRMIHPESLHKDSWITMSEEYDLLERLRPTGLAPLPYFLDTTTSPEILIQEFIEARAYNDLKPLSHQLLTEAARAIALLHEEQITPHDLPFLSRLTLESFNVDMRFVAMQKRLDDCRGWYARPDVIKWADEVSDLVTQACAVLRTQESAFQNAPMTFHFDGAHTGNVHWRTNRAVFLDWQSVSYRQDPSFTLVRFANSVNEGIVTNDLLDMLIDAYLAHRTVKIDNFREMAYACNLERQIADLVWVLWEMTLRKDERSVADASSTIQRFERLTEDLKHY